MTARSEDIRRIFDQAVDLPSGERTKFLASACDDDTSLMREVEALLVSDSARPDDYLDALRLIGELEIGEVVGGRYTLVERIGEGGVGVVYRAEQFKPVKRDVALKVVKLGMDTREVLARFEAERQALAMMDHPGIARIIDAGSTDGGRSYFVMDLVRGLPITQYCDEHALSTRERLELFIDTCEAVQHAHQKGVIHRDLKPSNVLVTEHAGKPAPTIIDFGIAKATTHPLTDHTAFTEVHQLVGTPAYMSPEQAGLDGQDVDTRADIYSLGILLYELLTGSTPFAATTLREKSYDAVRKLIRDVAPPKPSSRVSRHAAPATSLDVATRRRTDPATLARTLRGDLDWIVMKALEKDRTRRYESAGAFAADVARHLRSEPVLARPPSAAYRTSRFLRRNRAPVAGALAFAALLIGFSIAMVVKANENRRLAIREGLAKSDAQEALHVSNVMRGRLQARVGNIAAAENLLWREFLEAPGAIENRWALWGLYEQFPCVRTTMAHEGQSSCAPVFSPDGRLVVTGGQVDEYTVKVWEAPGLVCREVLHGHEGPVRRLSFAQNGRLLASSGDDGAVRVWDADDWELLHVIEPGAGAVLASCFLPPGDRLAIGCADGRLLIHDVSNGELVDEFADHDAQILRIQIAPDGRIATSDRDGVIHLTGDPDGAPRLTLKGHRSGVGSLAFTPDATTLATGSIDRMIKVWDLESGQCTSTIPAGNGTVRQLEFREDGRRLVASGWWRVDEWDVVTGERVHYGAMPVGTGGFAIDAERRPDGRLARQRRDLPPGRPVIIRTAPAHRTRR